jgi:hypothetical protein
MAPANLEKLKSALKDYGLMKGQKKEKK